MKMHSESMSQHFTQLIGRDVTVYNCVANDGGKRISTIIEIKSFSVINFELLKIIENFYINVAEHITCILEYDIFKSSYIMTISYE